MKKVTLKLCEALLQEFRLKRAISLRKTQKIIKLADKIQEIKKEDNSFRGIINILVKQADSAFRIIGVT